VLEDMASTYAYVAKVKAREISIQLSNANE
jgi:hypothetical protein